MSHSAKPEIKNDMDETTQMKKLREVLFGQQFRDHEKRYLRLEEKIKKEFDNLRNEMNLRLRSLEEIEENFVKDFEEFKRNTVKIENEIRQITLSNARDLATELGRIHKDMQSELLSEVKMLEDGKVNRTDLASILSEAVMQLNRPEGEKTH